MVDDVFNDSQRRLIVTSSLLRYLETVASVD